jgi:uncharacterized cupredoxin-like copper-binding protein
LPGVAIVSRVSDPEGSAMKTLSIRSLALPALAVAVALASLVSVQLASGRTDGSAKATATTVQVKGGEFFFRLSSKSIKRPGKVTFVFKNVGHVAHDFKISGRRTPLIQPGRTTRLVVTFKKKGRFPYMCTVPGHAASGMKGIFTVR